MMTELWLDPIPEFLRVDARAAFEARNAIGFLCKLADNRQALALVYHNLEALVSQGIYENALLLAYSITRSNHVQWPLSTLRYLFRRAERSRLRAAGDPIPGQESFVLYRGVGGRRPGRRVRGLSWTASAERAWWFADRAASIGLTDPAVYRINVHRDGILAYDNGRREEEFIVLLREHDHPRRVRRDGC